MSDEHHAVCDVCGKREPVSTPGNKPEGWRQISEPTRYMFDVCSLKCIDTWLIERVREERAAGRL